MENDKTADQGQAEMQECGLADVRLDQPGAPTPGRVTEWLADITTAMVKAVASGDLGAIASGVEALKQLRVALDARDAPMMESNMPPVDHHNVTHKERKLARKPSRVQRRRRMKVEGWYGSARTNYFRVKDSYTFTKWAESIGGLRVTENVEGQVVLLSEEEDGGWPRWRYNEATDEDEEMDLFQQVATHLQGDSVAVFVEVGADKLRQLTGLAVAVNASGKTVAIALHQIYELARSLGGEITGTEY
jgi:hypothetical protein